MAAYCKPDYKYDFIIAKENKERAYFDTKILSRKNYENYKNLLTINVSNKF
jgi:hypothetical protein